MVMLTLTRDNLDQVMPLAELLEGRTDSFNFNRLSTVGEGAQLMMPRRDDFENLLRQYEAAAESNPFMGLKDNLINIIRSEKEKPPFGGCAGFGCGAAFNFIALLPDGEVHACRKFPSPIGNIIQSSLMDIYHSEIARKYRNGSEACQGCSLDAVCRGCLASTYSYGLNVFKEKDPFCFLPEKHLPKQRKREIKS
jgi:selenobiotic family peptide radical SAM maturase